MGRTIGIDLGTTNSCVAVIEGDQVRILSNSEGGRVTPSVVAVTDGGDRLVGELAKRQAITNARNTVSAVKRFIGRKFHSPEVQRAIDVTPYEIFSAPNGDIRIRIQGAEYSPEEISAMILMKMKSTAEEGLGEPVIDAVITVPAYFDDSQRQATKDAGKIAGLNVVRIINEPTAAALAYGVHRKSKETIAVYDLGGGTFDISVLELSEGVFEVKSTRGDTYLGGEDFDNRVIEWMMTRFEREMGITLRGDSVVLQRLKEAGERAKIELSTAVETMINIPFLAADESGPKHMEYTLTRAEFENLVRDLVDRTLEPCEKAISDAGLDVDSIDSLILVGGMTRMPLVQERVKEFFGRFPLKGINPDEVVASGAAIQGGVLKGQVEDTVLLDVIPLSLGVETYGGVMTKIIERNTTIPTRVSKLFSTADDNQDMVRVHVLQGEREMAEHNRSLGIFELYGIPPQPRGVPQVEVIFDVDHNGILNVTARDRGTGKEQAIRIQAASGLSKGEIDRMIRDSDKYKEADAQAREAAKVRNSIANMLYQCQRSLKERGPELSPDKLGDLQWCVTELQTALDSERDVQRMRERLNAVLEKVKVALA